MWSPFLGAIVLDHLESVVQGRVGMYGENVVMYFGARRLSQGTTCVGRTP